MPNTPKSNTPKSDTRKSDSPPSDTPDTGRPDTDSPDSGTLALPIFPLTGTLLLPGNYLPLNIFEQRYRHLVEDVLADSNEFGMIQPVVPMGDNFGPPPGEEIPDLYEVGCVGRIVQSERQPDGRYLVVLQGVQRFRVRRELSTVRGYRRVAANLAEFVDDLDEPGKTLDPQRLMAEVKKLSLRFDLDLELLASLPGVTLVNGLAAALPISPIEKQALLEAATIDRREELLLELIGMGLDAPGPMADGSEPPLVN